MATVKIEGCYGCSACTGIAPDVFDMGDDMYAFCKIEGDIPENLMDDVNTAADVCPARAIIIE